MRDLRKVIDEIISYIPRNSNDQKIENLAKHLREVQEAQKFNAPENQDWDVVTYRLKTYAKHEGKVIPLWFEKILTIWNNPV